MTEVSRRVFDDENDRWIEVRYGETERDALLRARREGAPSVIPPRKPKTAQDAWSRSSRAKFGLNVMTISGLVIGLVVILVTHSELEHSLHEEAQRTYIAGVAAGVFFLFVGAIAGAASLVVIALSREN